MPIQAAVGDRFADVGRGDGGTVRQVGDGARDFYNAVIGAGG